MKKESVGYSPARKHFPRPHEILGSINTHEAPSTYTTPKTVSMEQNVRIPSANIWTSQSGKSKELTWCPSECHGGTRRTLRFSFLLLLT